MSKPFSRMTDIEKDAFVNAGTGRKLTKEQSAWKIRNWTIIKMIKAGQVPTDTFGQLAYSLFGGK